MRRKLVVSHTAQIGTMSDREQLEVLEAQILDASPGYPGLYDNGERTVTTDELPVAYSVVHQLRTYVTWTAVLYWEDGT